MEYGLGIVLSFDDEASEGLERVNQALLGLSETAEKVSKDTSDILNIQALQQFSTLTDNMGDTLLGAGKNVVGFFGGLIQNIANTGSQFENLRITLTQLKGSEQEAEEALQQLTSFAATTPFELNDLTGMFTTITANGLDAFKEIETAQGSAHESLLSYIGDLMAFRPDVPAMQWGTAIRNAFSGELRSLKNALDVDVTGLLGRDWGDTPEQIAQDFADLAEALNVTGLIGEMNDTWSVALSNLEDYFQQFLLAIADSGAYDRLKEALSGITETLQNAMSDGRVQKFAEVLGDALSVIITPLEKAAKGISTLIDWILDLSETNPGLAKLIISFTAISGILLIIGGVALKALSAFAGLSITLAYLPKTLSTLSAGFKALGARILPLVALGALLYAAWRLDFMGIRTYVTNFQNSFKEASSIVSMETDSMRAKLSELANSTDVWDRTTANLTKGMLFLKGVVESFTLGDGFTISEDTWDKLQSAGMLPMFEDFLDTKYRVMEFIDSFKEGFSQAVDFVSQKFSELAKVFEGTDLGDFLDNMAIALQGFSEMPVEQVQGLGNAFGQIAVYAPIVMIGVKAVLALGKAFSFLMGAVKIIGKPLSILFTALGGFSGIAKGIATAAKAIGTALGSGLGVVLGFFGGIVTAALSFIDMLKNGFSWVSEILMIVGIAVAAVAAFFAGIPAAIAAAVAAVIAIVLTGIIWVKDHFTEIKDWIGARIDDIKNFFTNLWLKVQETFTNIKNKASEIMESVKTFFSEKIEAIKGFFGGISEKASEVWSNLKQGASDAVDGIVSFFSSLPGRVNQFIEDIPVIGGAYKGVKSAVGGAVNAVKGAFGGSYATGGVFTEPSFIEVGEDGSEVVMPLEKNTGWINGLATNIGGFLQKNFLGTTTSLSTGQVKSINPKPVPSNPQPKGNVSPPPLVSNSSSTSNADYSQTDNSITFSAGAIVVNVANATEAEAERFAELIMRKIQRKQQLNRMNNYKDINYQQPEFAY